MSLSQVIARYFAVLTMLFSGLTVMAQTTDPDITETNPAEARGLEERLVLVFAS